MDKDLEVTTTSVEILPSDPNHKTIHIRPLPKPECAICSKPVDLYETYFDPILLRIYYHMKCHGDEQSFFTPIRKYADIDIPRAFGNEGIEILVIK